MRNKCVPLIRKEIGSYRLVRLFLWRCTLLASILVFALIEYSSRDAVKTIKTSYRDIGRGVTHLIVVSVAIVPLLWFALLVIVAVEVVIACALLLLGLVVVLIFTYFMYKEHI